MGRFFRDSDLHHTSLRVDGLLLVEDKVADTVVDWSPFILLDSLEGMGMMADKGIGTSIYQLMSLLALLGYRLQGVLTSPMQRDDDITMRIGDFQLTHLY